MKVLFGILGAGLLASCASPSDNSHANFDDRPEMVESRLPLLSQIFNESNAGEGGTELRLRDSTGKDSRSVTGKELGGTAASSDLSILRELRASAKSAALQSDLDSAINALTVSSSERAWKLMQAFLKEDDFVSAERIASIALRHAPTEDLEGSGSAESGQAWRVVPHSRVFTTSAPDDPANDAFDVDDEETLASILPMNFAAALLRQVCGSEARVFSGPTASVVVAAPDDLSFLEAYLRSRSEKPKTYTMTFEYVVVDATESPFAQDLKSLLSDPVAKPQAEIDALLKSGKLHRIAAPRITSLEGQAATITINHATSYISGFEYMVVAEGLIADPVVGVFNEGLHVGARVTQGLNGHVFAAIEAVDIHQVSASIPQYEIELWKGAAVTVQAPALRAARGAALGQLDLDQTYLLRSRLKVVWNNESRHDAFLLFRISEVKD